MKLNLLLTKFKHLFLRSVSHAYTWKLIKPHMVAVIQDVIFPIMSFTDSDQELWESDPYEYIRLKFGKRSSPARFALYL